MNGYTKKSNGDVRVSLRVPPNVYDKLQEIKYKKGILNDSQAIRELITNNTDRQTTPTITPHDFNFPLFYAYLTLIITIIGYQVKDWVLTILGILGAAFLTLSLILPYISTRRKTWRQTQA